MAKRIVSVVAVAMLIVSTPAAASIELTRDWLVEDVFGARYLDGAAAESGAVVLAGSVLVPQPGGGIDIPEGYVAKIGSSGNRLWEQRIVGSYDPDGPRAGVNGVAVAADGAVYATGWLPIAPDDAHGIPSHEDAFVAKFGPNGQEEWRQTFDWTPPWVLAANEAGVAVTTTADGAAIIVGNCCDVYVMRFEPDGSLGWETTFSAGAFHEAEDVAVTSEGEVVVVSRYGHAGHGVITWLGPDGDVRRDVDLGAVGPMSVASHPDGGVVVAHQTVLRRYLPGGSEAWNAAVTVDGTAADVRDVVVEADGSIVAFHQGPAGRLQGYTASGEPDGLAQPVLGVLGPSSVVATSDGDLVAISWALAQDSVFTERFLDSSEGDQTVAGFEDVLIGAFYADPVTWLRYEGITKGTSDTSYSPADAVTRGQMATFLWRLVGSPTGNPDHGFSDVPSGAFYEPAVRWLRATGITEGTSATTFSPADGVTRGQMAAFLWRLAGSPAVSEEHGFSDIVPGRYYGLAVRWLRQQGITVGTSPTTFSPGDVVTRGQMATFLFRLATASDWEYPGAAG